MKKYLLGVLFVLLFINPVYGDYVIDETNSIIINGWIENTVETVKRTNVNCIDIDIITKALNEVDYNFADFTVHTVDYQLDSQDALGIALPNNTIILFDFIPHKLDDVYQNVVTHELGHLVYMSMNEAQQLEYKRIRKIPNEWDNYPKTLYVNRPQEIFAEDFKILFGGDISKSYSHFNQILEPPDDIRGLKRFIRQFEYKE